MSERLQRYLIWMAAAFLVIGTALALRYARGYRPLVGFSFSGPPPLPGDIGLRFEHVRVVGRQNNQRAWTVKAGRIETTRSRSRLDFSSNVEAELIAGGNVAATFSAPQATYDANARVLVAAGNVAGTVRAAKLRQMGAAASASGDLRIEAQQVVWNVGSHNVACPGRVRTSLPGLDVEGDDLSVDLLTQDYALKHFRADVALNGDTSSGGPLSALKVLAP